MAWLCRAQDHSASADGGVARDYSLLSGWASSYPETTGYIIPTFIEYARRTGSAEMRERARRMADWLAAHPASRRRLSGREDRFQPGRPGDLQYRASPARAGGRGKRIRGGYRSALRRAADWLVETQDADGCWRRYPTPFAAAGEKEYETHVAWGLFEAERIENRARLRRGGLANVRWALSSQGRDGWFPKCCLDDAARPLTHTIAYALARRAGGVPVQFRSALSRGRPAHRG